MKTKLIACFFAVVMLFAFSTVAMADSIKDGDQVYVAKTNGGDMFLVKNLSLTPLFYTFCLELNEYLDGQPFTAHIDTYAIAGGIGGVLPGDPGDYISNKTAYLYFNFRNGTLPDFNIGNVENNNALAFAFWILEEERTLASVNPVLYASFYPQLIEYLAFADSTSWVVGDIGNVRVLNVTDASGVNKQSFLTLVPEPMSLLLLGLGLLGLGMTRRQINK
jgi:hypothetical protein